MMLNTKKGVMRVVGPAPMGGDYIEIIVDEPPLRNAMLRYSVDLLLISLLISGITAALVYLTLHYLFVRPMRRVTANMTAFRADPEDPDRIIVPSGRIDEIGIAERELADHADRARLDAAAEEPAGRARARGIEDQPRSAQPARFGAALLRSPGRRLPDPNVQRFAPKLCTRSSAPSPICQSTLSYGRLQEPPPDRKPILLEPLVEEVHETLGLAPGLPDPLDQRGRARPRWWRPTTTSSSASC